MDKKRNDGEVSPFCLAFHPNHLSCAVQACVCMCVCVEGLPTKAFFSATPTEHLVPQNLFSSVRLQPLVTHSDLIVFIELH